MTDVPSAPPPAFPRRRIRWAAPPLAAGVLLAGFGLVPSLASADAPPVLPAISTQDLVAKALGAHSVAGFTGTIETNTDLGLPNVGDALGPQNGNLLTTLLAPHTVQVWYAQGGKVRLAIPDKLAETDVVSDGTQVWVWQSATQSVTHLTKPAAATPDGGDKHRPDVPDSPDVAGPASPEDLTPPAVAAKLLASADPTTRVFVRGTATVAGRPAYELVLAPRTPDTLVADAVLDIDAATGLPLRVQVLAQDSNSPALDIGFTSLDLTTPVDKNFTFTVPPGATVREVTRPEDLLSGPSFGPDGQRHKFRDGRGVKVKPGAAPDPALAPDNAADPANANGGQRQVIGSGWDAVVVLPNSVGGVAQLGTSVSGTWGSGRLVTSKLVEALILPDGRMLVGLVPASRLEAVAGQLAHS